MRRYRIHMIASKGRFYCAGEPIPDDVSVAQGQRDIALSKSRSTMSDHRERASDDETKERTTRERGRIVNEVKQSFFRDVKSGSF